ncbi:hypothetical protein BDP81DRAFT_156810 [Colletotrichum phormii]|uniref:Uncharacterized protein n=1 Tax=Colletotrichum phormii TaxID=359342 RepID=A0AAI9ZCR7_9PEZI|nr:uncharacterized protein BDP81DRAFT_156810 [Colletotrichum phormii]KAK1622122.1 hypothetical protein BDP81DRAFT_156810 [Colletotrichum phormii]
MMATSRTSLTQSLCVSRPTLSTNRLIQQPKKDLPSLAHLIRINSTDSQICPHHHATSKMCTIHIIKCHDCNTIQSTWCQYCASTPPNRLCHRGQTSRITTYLLRGHYDLCLTKMGTYNSLRPVETTSTAVHRAINRKSMSGPSSMFRVERCVNSLSMRLKRLTSDARRFYSGLEHGLSNRAKTRWQVMKRKMSRDLELISQNQTRG